MLFGLDDHIDVTHQLSDNTLLKRLCLVAELLEPAWVVRRCSQSQMGKGNCLLDLGAFKL